MPAITGLSPSCSAVLPIRPSPSARRVPRWRGDSPIALLTCVRRRRRLPPPEGRAGFAEAAGLPDVEASASLEAGMSVRPCSGTDRLRLLRLVRQDFDDRLAPRLRDVLRASEAAQRRLR